MRPYSNNQLSILTAVILGAAGFSPLARVRASGNDRQEERVIPEIQWDTTINKFQFDADKFIGQRLTLQCPPKPIEIDSLPVHGTGFYSSESPICMAALHAGVITKDGGTVTLQLNPGRPKYSGSEQNGVLSHDLPETPRSFAFVRASKTKEIDEIRLERLPRIDWDTKFTATGLAHRHLVGQRFSFRIPAMAAGKRPRLVYGTDHYDFASRIAWAALHAGQVTEEGGIVTLQIDSGSRRLVGSIRNGVETKSKTSGDRTIRFIGGTISKR